MGQTMVCVCGVCSRASHAALQSLSFGVASRTNRREIVRKTDTSFLLMSFASTASRRTLLLGLASVVTPAAAVAAPHPLRTPYTDRDNVEFGLTADNRVRPCPGATGANCASSSSSSDLYAPPLQSETSVDACADALVDAASLRYDARVRSRSSIDGGAVFLTMDVKAARGDGRDILEVLIKPTSGGSGSTILFRAVADPASVTYIFPLQTPLSDGGAQRARVRALAVDLGWRASGCDLLECFLE